jgi:hypothetical protein
MNLKPSKRGVITLFAKKSYDFGNPTTKKPTEVGLA